MIFQWIYRSVQSCLQSSLKTSLSPLKEPSCSLEAPTCFFLGSVYLISLYINLPFLDNCHKWTCRGRGLLVTGFMHVVKCLGGSTRSQHTSVVCSFLLLNDVPLYEYTTICFSIHHLRTYGCFQVLVKVINAAMTFTYMFFCGHIFSILLGVELVI